MLITFPSKTAKQIVDECNNKIGDGKLMYSIDWYKDEAFYTKEKCRARTIEVTDEVKHLSKSWNECRELVGEENILNFPEMIWFIKTYLDKTGKYPEKWSWTSSHSSYGNRVYVGFADPGGVGVVSVATKGAKGGKPEACSRNLEQRLNKVEAWIRKIETWIRKEDGFLNPFD